jgi:hypothetical protein
MRGVPAIAANSREGSRLLQLWVRVTNTNSEIGATLARVVEVKQIRPAIIVPSDLA